MLNVAKNRIDDSTFLCAFRLKTRQYP